MRTLSTLLIANRGEIAVRVMRTARSLGIRTVAVYSDADEAALHVRVADQSVRIGDSPVGDSYLNIEAVITAAQQCGADAVHPGYGFLSENQKFADACEAAGLIFIGPPKAAIDVMGDKAKAKRAMLAAGVPCIPGYQGEAQDESTLVAEANRIGMPVMLKAAAGGGGRGMRLVEDAANLSSAMALAKSEAQNAFGSSELIIEKAVLRPRHVEIQVFADQHGNVLHLGERDCSVQRRHQKVVEESPCPVMTDTLRAAMGAAAVEAARAVDYVGAGTVEFLLDQNGEFFFLEMNTRLQVEHPVTEMVTGLDLVEWQLRVARGEPLPLVQDDVSLLGHAIEVRLYAEEPEQGFLPSTGPVHLFSLPESEGLRVDTGVESGDSVSPYYDAMVAKVIGYGDTREDARRRLLSGLQAGALLGLGNNRDFLIDVLEREAFVRGEATTAFIGENYGDLFSRDELPTAIVAAAAVIQHVLAMTRGARLAPSVSAELLDWSSRGRSVSVRDYGTPDAANIVTLETTSTGEYGVQVGEHTHQVALQSFATPHCELVCDGLRTPYQFVELEGVTLHISSPHHTAVFTDRRRITPDAEEVAGGGTVVAPMHGQLLTVEVEPGDVVEQGRRLAVLEAMKMQHEICAPASGAVIEITVREGAQVAAGDTLILLDVED